MTTNIECSLLQTLFKTIYWNTNILWGTDEMEIYSDCKGVMIRNLDFYLLGIPSLSCYTLQQGKSQTKQSQILYCAYFLEI